MCAMLALVFCCKYLPDAASRFYSACLPSRFVPLLEQCCSWSCCLSTTVLHLAKSTVICCFQSCICIIAFLSGVCMLEFMLIDNNRLASFFLNDLSRYKIGCNSSPCPPPFLPARDIYPHPWFRRVLTFRVTFTNPCKTERHIVKCSTEVPVIFYLPHSPHWLILCFSVW